MYVPLQERERERERERRERESRERERQEKTHVFKMVIMRGKALLVECAIKIILQSWL